MSFFVAPKKKGARCGMSYARETIDFYTYSAILNTVVHEGITAFAKKK
ncbi:hypothetical protein [Listeria fleischmannii]